eukprot:gb/GECG01000551.1/.p1 GENE.gb/GECG01000551.1/~~gb/GECG01000551.1/.p1  ORF type:complete len:261 (+),score=27.28 gb/GECG01000551.1/:1-783(+)
MLNCNAVHKQKPLSVREYDTMRAGLLKILLFAASIHAVHATIGVSFSTRSPGSHEWTIEDLKCAKQHGATVSIPRCYFSGNTTNEDCAKSIIDSWKAGMSEVHIRMTVCANFVGDCTPEGQVKYMLNTLSNNGISPSNSPPYTYDRVWVQPKVGLFWTNDKKKNKEFFKSIISHLEKANQTIGIYTEMAGEAWNNTFGDFTELGGYPLWYKLTDGIANFTDFQPFQGWSKPTMKLFHSSINVLECAALAEVEVNWLPGPA